MTYLERISRSPLTARDKRRTERDAERLRKRGARRMLARELDVLRKDILEAMKRHEADYLEKYGLHGFRSMSVATWLAKV